MKKKSTMLSMPENDRPYEKCLLYGPEKLQDEELLAVILRTGTVGCNVLDTAREILNRARGSDGLLAIHQLSVRELTEIPGVGQVKAMQIRCLSELCKRLAGIKSREGEELDSPELVAGYYMEKLRHEQQENIWLLMMDKKNHRLGEKCISRGTVDTSVISPREILIEALKCQAVNLIVLHNHPSGNPAPSREDICLTERIRQSADMVGLHLVDHIIIGDQSYYNFVENSMSGL